MLKINSQTVYQMKYIKTEFDGTCLHFFSFRGVNDLGIVKWFISGENMYR